MEWDRLPPLGHDENPDRPTPNTGTALEMKHTNSLMPWYEVMQTVGLFVLIHVHCPYYYCTFERQEAQQ